MGGKCAENEHWHNFLELFCQAMDLKHDSPAANYDLAVAFEVKGELHLAKIYYESAFRLNPESDYRKSVAHIEDRLTSQEKLNLQLD